ncbi:MAG: metallophosphoesterase, partial [Ruminococcus sp.]|nr:metallophosphoesterase [Candidatus Copronaster equi]
MKATVFSKLGYRIMTLIVTFLYSLNGYVAPATNDPIRTSSQTGANLTVIAWADSQLSNYMFKRFRYFDAACEDVSNISENVDAFFIAGDIAENGLRCEYQYITEKLVNAKTDNFLMLVGNHDVRLKNYKNTVKNFTAFANNLNEKIASPLRISSLNYRYDVKGYTFIVLGTDKTVFEESYFSQEQLDWLDTNLKDATASGKPVFVLCHQSLKLTHGLPDTWG